MANQNDLIRESDNSRVPAQMVSTQPMGTNIMIAKATNRSLNIPPNTTLNEHHEVEVNNSLGVKNGLDFVLGYFGVGIKGYQVVGNHPVTQVPVNYTNQHQPFDQNLFYSIPMCARPLDDDLNDQERDKYRMRTVAILDGVPTALYWLMKTGMSEFNPKTKRAYRNPATGNEVPEDYVYRPESLNPTPITLSSNGTVPLANTYLTSSGLMDLSLNGTALEELRNVCRLMFGDPSLAAVSEYQIVWGIESTTEGQGAGGTTFRYKELISAVTQYVISERHARDANSNGDIVLKYDLGAAYPMLLEE
ncbi:putative virion structural protein [Vibrio phage phiKT1019]|nr:putative virion structural protein [Vibrio phage phiKT1019]